MTSREYDCVAAHESVLTVLTDNAGLYPTFKPLIRARTELESVVAGITAAGQKQETSAKSRAWATRNSRRGSVS